MSLDNRIEMEGKSRNTNIISVIQERDVFQHDNWFEELIEILFHVKQRGSSVSTEVLCGLIQFISCMYILPVVPEQLEAAGYHVSASVVSVAVVSGIGSILGGLFCNLPFIIAPPTAISIFLSIYVQQEGLQTSTGNFSVICSGFLLILLGWKPFGSFLTRFIPPPIQVGAAVGIGLITALAGATEIGLVVRGEYTIVELGVITPRVVIACAGIIIASVSLHYHLKGAFCMTLLFGTLVFWISNDEFPHKYVDFSPSADIMNNMDDVNFSHSVLLTFDLLFLYIITLNGLVSSLSDLSGLTRENGSTPRNRWLFIWCGLVSILSGFMSGPPILISPESAGGIKAGARTGLSTVVCGILFCVSSLFAPVLKEVPSAGTAPLLIMVGVILFQNVKKLDWTVMKDAVPAFCVLFFIPFTYSILQGVGIGYAMYVIIGLSTGELYDNAMKLYCDYFEPEIRPGQSMDAVDNNIKVILSQ